MFLHLFEPTSPPNYDKMSFFTTTTLLGIKIGQIDGNARKHFWAFGPNNSAQWEIIFCTTSNFPLIARAEDIGILLLSWRHGKVDFSALRKYFFEILFFTGTTHFRKISNFQFRQFLWCFLERRFQKLVEHEGRIYGKNNFNIFPGWIFLYVFSRVPLLRNRYIFVWP